jgi:hypothetical protein
MNDYYRGLATSLEDATYGTPEYYKALGSVQTARQSLLDSNKPSMFGLASPTWQGVGSTLQGLGGLASAYMAYKQYGLAKDAFNFNKGLANRNLATQGQLLNQEMYDRKARELAGSSLSPEEKARALEEVKNKYIDTTPIK